MSRPLHGRMPMSKTLTSITLASLVAVGGVMGNRLVAEETVVEDLPVEVVENVSANSQQDDVAVADMGDEEDPALRAMREELEKLQLEQQLADARLQKDLRKINEESQRIAAQQALDAARESLLVADLQAQVARLQAESAVAEAKHQEEIRELRVSQEKQGLIVAQQEIELQEISFENRKKMITNEVLNAQFAQEEIERQRVLAEDNFALLQAQTSLGAIEQQKQLDAIITDPVARPLEPFVDGVLYVSDRRIDLNEPIIVGSGDWIARRINFFNRESTEEPIFIVIDYCPGGSIMEGEIILRAMRSSKAPIHMVVKSFAASMAAVMLSEAEHSYTLPNASIMHHQPWSHIQGNLAQQKEWVDNFKQWAVRLHTPTAERMGLTLDEFYTLMYEKTVSGDWTEFGDEAQKLTWVQHVATEIVEGDINRRPEDPSPYNAYRFWQKSAEATADERVRLPRLRAFDGYFLYNRDGRFYVAE